MTNGKYRKMTSEIEEEKKATTITLAHKLNHVLEKYVYGGTKKNSCKNEQT